MTQFDLQELAADPHHADPQEELNQGEDDIKPSYLEEILYF